VKIYFQSWENPEVEPPRLVTFLRQVISKHWALKLLILALLGIIALIWCAYTLVLSFPFITPLWYGWWLNDRPSLYNLYPPLGFVMLWITVFIPAWFRLRLTEPRRWSNWKLAWFALRLVMLWVISFHLIIVGGGVIATGNYWFGLTAFGLGFTIIVQPAASIHFFDAYIIDPPPPKTRNDILAYFAITAMGGILVVLFSLMVVDWQ